MIFLKNLIFKGKMSIHSLMYRKLMNSSHIRRGSQVLVLKVIHKKLFVSLLEKLNFKIKTLFSNVFSNSYYSFRHSFFHLKQHLLGYGYYPEVVTMGNRNSTFLLQKIYSLLRDSFSENSLVFAKMLNQTSNLNPSITTICPILSSSSTPLKKKCLFVSSLYSDRGLKNELKYIYDYMMMSILYKRESLSLINFSYFAKVLVLNLNLIRMKGIYYEDIWNLAGFSQPTKTRKFTVLRSPHIDKKSREQFERRVYKKGFILPYFFHPSLESSFLKKRLSNELFFAVYSKLTKNIY